MGVITLVAPFSGWAMPLTQVPDAVFAGAMMGEGLAIEPLDDVVRSPCDAEVEAIAATGHSITLRLANNATVLIHVGVDTVALGGEGFRARVSPGDRVTAGAPLIGFDLDALACAAPSLATPIVVPSEGFTIELLATNKRVAAGDAIIRIAPSAQVARVEASGSARRELVVPLAHGLHARPAARIAALVKELDGIVRIEAKGGEADARSPIGVMKLAIARGDRITLSGSSAAVHAVAVLIESGMGETNPAPAPAMVSPARVMGDVIHGAPASPGLGLGPAFRFSSPEIAIPEYGEGLAAERARLEMALSQVRGELEKGGSIASAQRAMLDDPELQASTDNLIADGRSAAAAWRIATREQADALAGSGNPLLAERAADLHDIGRRVIAQIMGVDHAPPRPPAGVVLVAEDLLPSQLLALNSAGLAGIATARGGPTSHVAILAAATGVPMVVACGPALLSAREGQAVAIDGGAGLIDLAPDMRRHEKAVAQARSRRTAEASAAHALALTTDGQRIEVFANLGSVADAEAAVAAGAEGCGLLRTEFLFLDRDAAPSEEEQADAYAAIAAALGGRPLIVRTMDVGGDKPIAWLPLPPEENPALGARGIRLGLSRPNLLTAQFRAILRGVPAGQCLIMLPMVNDRSDLLAARALLDRAADATNRPTPPLGAMIETPAAALVASTLARDAAFLSVGTNDLTQYALAADRGNPAVAARIDALHPAVLRLIASAGGGAAAHGRWLGVCGALASDPAAAALLVGLGVTELSASPAAVPAMKAAVRRLDTAQCRALAAEALTLATPADVRALLA